MHSLFARFVPSFALLMLVLLPAQGFAFAAKPDAGPTDSSTGEAEADSGSADKMPPPQDGFAQEDLPPQDDAQDPPAGCKTSADCGSCAACVNGECKGLGAIMCKNDGECAPGQVCEVNATDACKNQCVTKPQCKSNDECPKCTVCAAGSCKGLGVVQCMNDKECAAGEVCNVVAGETCKNACVAKPAETDTVSSDGGASVDTAAGPDAVASDVGAKSDTATGSDAAGTLDGSAPDSGGKTVTPAPSPATGCSANPVGASPWALLLLMLGFVVLRRRFA